MVEEVEQSMGMNVVVNNVVLAVVGETGGNVVVEQFTMLTNK